MTSPTTENVLSAVCNELFAIREKLYSPNSLGIFPINPKDLMTEPSKYRPHSDARMITAVILRKHVLWPYSFSDQRHPTFKIIRQQLCMSPTGLLKDRMGRMCGRMRTLADFRGVYVRAVQTLQAGGFDLVMTDNIERSLPCQ